MTKVAINEMGRIGRAVLKVVLDTPDLELSAVNDLLVMSKNNSVGLNGVLFNPSRA